jgi:cold shock CspA family protein
MEKKAASLLSEKITKELYRIAQAYGKEHPYAFDDLKHDLCVMLEYDAVTAVTLKFYRPDADREVLAEYAYSLHAGNPQFHLDDAMGIGIVPIKPPFEMALVVQRDSMNGVYEGDLKLNWGSAPRYAKNGGFDHQDGNTTRRTGGRASKQVYMADDLRRQGRVKFYLPDKRYGFIIGPDGTDVFFHANNATGLTPRKDQKVTYQPLVTPRGVQAKDVRAA